VKSEIGKSNPSFAAESARLESIYNHQSAAPANPGVGGPTFDFGPAQPAPKKGK